MALLAPVLVVAAACGGDDEGTAAEGTPSGVSAASSASVTRSPEPTAAPIERPATGTPTAATEVTQTPGSLRSSAVASPYQSFHYLVTIDMGVVDGATDAVFGGRVEGDYVAPDRHAFTNEFGFAGISFTTNSVIIGNEAWNQEGSGPWSATTLDALFVDGSTGLTSVDPEFFGFDTDAADGFGAMNGEPETLNGIATTRYVLTKELYEAVAPFLGDTPTGDMDISDFEEFSTTVWLDNEANALVKMDLYMTAPAAVMGNDLGALGLAADATLSMTMSFEMTRINDESISIEPPLP